MDRPRRDRGGWRRAITLIALLGALSILFVVVAPLDGVADRIAEGQEVGSEGAGRNETAVDARLVLQIGMLFAALYVAFLCVWLARTRGGDWTTRNTLARIRSRWIVAVSVLRVRLLGRRAAAGAPSVCSIAWKHGHHPSRFQAVISTPGDRRQRVLAESAELEAARRDGVRALAAASGPRGQIAVADALARAHRSAAVTLAPIGVAGDPVPARTVAALSSASSAYTELANAVHAGSDRRYVGAARAVRSADAELRGALGRAAAAANTASSPPAGRPARPADKSTDLTVLLLGLSGAGAVLLAALGAAREVRHAR